MNGARRGALAAVVALTSLGCRKGEDTSATRAADATAPAIDASVTPVGVTWPAAIEEVLFTTRGDFVAFQDATKAVLVDVRSPMGVARNASAPFRPGPPAAGAPTLATRRNGELGIVGPGRLEELATGKVLEVQGELREGYVLGTDPAGTVVTLYDGTMRSFPPGLRPLGPSDLLAGMVERAGGTVAVLVDPEAGRTFEPEEGTSVDTAARVGDAKTLVVVHSHAGPMKTVVYGADPRKPLASIAVSGIVLDLEVSPDGKAAAWSEVQKVGATMRCSGVVYVAATDTFTRVPAFPCATDGPQAKVLEVSADRVAWTGREVVAFDAKTGAKLPKPPAKAKADAGVAYDAGDASSPGPDVERAAVSHDGSKRAVVTRGEVRVLDVRTGDTLYRAAR